VTSIGSSRHLTTPTDGGSGTGARDSILPRSAPSNRCRLHQSPSEHECGCRPAVADTHLLVATSGHLVLAGCRRLVAWQAPAGTIAARRGISSSPSRRGMQRLHDCLACDAAVRIRSHAIYLTAGVGRSRHRQSGRSSIARCAHPDAPGRLRADRAPRLPRANGDRALSRMRYRAPVIRDQALRPCGPAFGAVGPGWWPDFLRSSPCAAVDRPTARRRARSAGRVAGSGASPLSFSSWRISSAGCYGELVTLEPTGWCWSAGGRGRCWRNCSGPGASPCPRDAWPRSPPKADRIRVYVDGPALAGPGGSRAASGAFGDCPRDRPSRSAARCLYVPTRILTGRAGSRAIRP